MIYWTNSEAAREFRTSPASIGRWVANSLDKFNDKYNLILEKNPKNHKWQIVKNEHNRALLSKWAEENRIYKTEKSFKKISPETSFYKVFNEKQIIELVTNLENHKRIPLKFSYVKEGADLWNKFILTQKDYVLGDKLLIQTFDFLKNNLHDFDHINIIDLGTGNGFVIKPLIEMLIKNNFQISYLGIDYSQRMIDIISNNLKKWYPQLPIKTQIADIEYLFLQERLFLNKIEQKNSCNLILFLGYTLGNIYDRNRVLRNLSDSMSKNDYLIMNNALDIISKRYNFKSLENKNSIKRITYVVNKLGFNEDDYERINKFDEKIQSRVQILRLNKDIELEIKFKKGNKKILFKENDEIMIWNHYRHTIDSLFYEFKNNDLDISYLAKSAQKNEILVVCEPVLIN